MQNIKSVNRKNKCERNLNSMAEGERFGKQRIKNHMQIMRIPKIESTTNEVEEK